MLKRMIIMVVMFSILAIYAQDKAAPVQNDNAKYTVVNSMIQQVVQTGEGLIVTYKVDRTFKTCYLPNKFFKEKIAVRIDENNSNVSPQMSVVLKDGKPYRVKLYLANNQSNMTYRLAEIISEETRNKFKLETLTIEF